MQSPIDLVKCDCSTFQATATLDYVFKEEWRVGYEVDTTKNPKDIGPISYRKKYGNNLNQDNYNFQVNLEEMKKVPIELGVDIPIEPEVGVAFYVILQGFLQVPITLELTMRFPDSKNHKLCVKNEPSKDWIFTLWYGVKLDFKVGGRISLSDLPVFGKMMLTAGITASWEVKAKR